MKEFKLEGVDKLLRKVSSERFVNGIRRAHFDYGKALIKETKKLTKEPKHGKLYRVNGRLHRASAPGEPWARLTGDSTKQATRKGGKYIGFAVENIDLFFTNTAPQAATWELATDDKRRPTMITAIKNTTKDAQSFYEKRILGEINKYD